MQCSEKIRLCSSLMLQLARLSTATNLEAAPWQQFTIVTTQEQLPV